MFFDALLCFLKTPLFLSLSQGSQGLPGVPGARGKPGPLVSNQMSSASSSPFPKAECPAGKTAWQGCALLNRKGSSREPAHFSPFFSDFCREKLVTKVRSGFQDHLALRYVPQCWGLPCGGIYCSLINEGPVLFKRKMGQTVHLVPSDNPTLTLPDLQLVFLPDLSKPFSSCFVTCKSHM